MPQGILFCRAVSRKKRKSIISKSISLSLYPLFFTSALPIFVIMKPEDAQ
jgi:hypothetical protein